MAISLGGTALTNVTVCDMAELFVGQQSRSLNGTLLTDYARITKKFTLECELLTAAQRGTVAALAGSAASQTFVDADAVSYTVQVTRGTYKETRVPGGSSGAPAWYDVAFELEVV